MVWSSVAQCLLCNSSKYVVRLCNLCASKNYNNTAHNSVDSPKFRSSFVNKKLKNSARLLSHNFIESIDQYF